MTKAQEWIRTDETACRNDVSLLGLDGATEYQMGLIADRGAMGDHRWDDISQDDMRAALASMEAE